MLLTTVHAIVLLAVAQLVTSHSMEIDAPTVWGARVGGRSTVWRSIEENELESVQRNSNTNDFKIGMKRPTSVLVKREVIVSWNETTLYRAYTAGVITYIEALDQSNGSGGYVRYYRGGVQNTFVELEFSRIAAAEGAIDFIVDVWTYPDENAITASEFRLGELTDRSAFHIGINFETEAAEYETITMSWAMYGMPEDKFTFIEAFDLSDDNSGGIVSLISGGAGHNFFYIGVRAVAAGMPLKVGFAAYSVDTLNGGQNFRFGSYRPRMQLLGFDVLERNAVAGEIVSDTFQHAHDGSTIQFVQGWDKVANGTGVLAAIAGGIGFSNISMVVNSGVSEDLLMIVGVYGSVHMELE